MLVGQTLIISQSSAPSESSQTEVPSSTPETEDPEEEQPEEEPEENASASPRTHTVQDGDSLWDISIQYDVSVEQLQQLNPDISKSNV